MAENGWLQYQKLVLSKLDEFGKAILKQDDQIGDLKVRIAILQGMVAAVSILAALLKIFD